MYLCSLAYPQVRPDNRPTGQCDVLTDSKYFSLYGVSVYLEKSLQLTVVTTTSRPVFVFKVTGNVASALLRRVDVSFAAAPMPNLMPLKRCSRTVLVA